MAGLGDTVNEIKNKFLGNSELRQLDKKKVFGILFIALVIIYIDVAFLMSLQLKAIKKTDAEFKKLDAEMDRFDQENAKYQKAKSGKTAITKEIINEAEIPLLLQDITDLANKNNVKILQLNPAREAQAKKGAAAAGPSYSLVSLELVCDYYSLSVFINEIENAQKFMAVDELRIGPNSDSMFQQSVVLVLKTYVKK